MKYSTKFFLGSALLAFLLLSNCNFFSNKGFKVSSLRVEYENTPLGIDVSHPRFSWQMEALDVKRGYSQAAYKIVVKDESGQIVWDPEEVNCDESLNIRYQGKELMASTRYYWSVKVWDEDGNSRTANSWFETGLMDPGPQLTAWEGAAWIGGGDDDLVLFSHFLPVFKLSYKLQLDESSATTRAGFIFGANDSRLMDKNMNIFEVEAVKDGSYIKFELDISEIDGSENGLARLNVYRVGYHPADRSDEPFSILPIPLTLIDITNKYEPHEVLIECVMGLFDIFINGSESRNLLSIDRSGLPGGQRKLNLNPHGYGHDYISFPMLADIGFAVDKGQNASFSDIEVTNYRSPNNVLFYEDLQEPGTYDGIFREFSKSSGSKLVIRDNTYQVSGVTDGVLFIADPSRNSMPMLRTVFSIEKKKVSRARLYVTARGIYELYLNGQRVGEDYFNPGLTEYYKTHMYQTYDVTGMVNTGSNALGAWLGEGWWSGSITYLATNWNFFGDRQSLLAKLVVTYADGSREVVTTNPYDWKYFNDGPLVYSSFFQGEVYDATRENKVTGWSTPDYDDKNWKQAELVPLEGTIYGDKDNYSDMRLIGQIGQNAGIVRELTAIAVEEVRPGVYVYDMGQNMVGFPEIEIKGGVSDSKITLRFAEVKYPDLPQYGRNTGMIMLENIRAALTQDIHILKGGNEIIKPRFTFHGYRYLEITGIPEALPIEAVKGKVISSVSEFASSFESSNPLVNKLMNNIRWSTLGNFLSIPTDCPQRNERMGWGGDISVFSRTATFLTNSPQFFRRHMVATRDIQRADGRFPDVAPVGGGFGGILWGSAGITVAWESYQQYGDKDMLAEHYDAMDKYMRYLETRIHPQTGVINEGPLGDWLSPENSKNDNTLIWEAYYVYNLETMYRIALILEKEEDAEEYKQKHNERKSLFNKVYVEPSTGKTVNSTFLAKSVRTEGTNTSPDDYFVDTQVSYAVPLGLGVFNDENEPFAVHRLNESITRKNTDDLGIERPEYSLMTGFIGTAWISKALSDHGYHETAYRLLQNTSYPSWLYPVRQGATTIWERLNSYTIEDGFGGNNSMNSFNHYSFGAVGAWMFNHSLGIERDVDFPGFKHFVLRPNPDPTGEMTYAKGYYDSMYGRIKSSWKLEDEDYIYEVTVPANTTALLYLPSQRDSNILEGGMPAMEAEGISYIDHVDGKTIFRLKSGQYDFKINRHNQ
jgi:alpha-L-rhamnosidase